VPEKTLGLILGGGRGERLFPLTQERSKPAVPFAASTAWWTSHQQLHQARDPPHLRPHPVQLRLASQSHQPHLSLDAFGRSFVDILAAEQTLESKNWYQGTADAVRQNLRHREPRGVDRT
jgi:glucose-1-phosphate adenylyltransferase